MKSICALAVGLYGHPSAIAVIERRPRIVGHREKRSGDDIHRDPIFADDHEVRYLERIAAGEPVPVVVQRAKALLARTELAGDVDFVLDTGGHGRAIVEMFYAMRPTAPAHRIAIGGETESTNGAIGGWTIPELDVRGALSLHVQEGRLKLAEGLPLGPELQRAIENPPASLNADVYLATALAVWLGRRVQTHGPWPSSKPPHFASPEAEELRRSRRDRAAWAATTKRKTKEWWQA